MLTSQTPRPPGPTRGSITPTTSTTCAPRTAGHVVETIETQAGGAALVTTGDPSGSAAAIGAGSSPPSSTRMASFETASMLGGVPVFGYCCV